MLKTMFGNKSVTHSASAPEDGVATATHPHAYAAATPSHVPAGVTPASTDPAPEQWFQFAFENLPVNAMFCDRDLTLKYLNKSSRNTLRSMQQYLPLPVEQLVGNSIHIFHRRTENVESVLGAKHHHGMHKLPHRAIIQVGPEKLDLELDAINNDRGEYIGVVVVWSQATKKLEGIQKTQDALRDNVSEVNRQLQMVSSATHEIESSIGEVAKNAMQVEGATRKFTEAGQEGLQAIEHLQESSNGVAKVAELIASIATQTSVLALNATIEAARAGVHGKGFSVVAGEVKKLAEQTAAATSDIQGKVTVIRGDIDTALHAIGRIDAEAGELSALSHQLAAAAEEQRLSTKEMAHSLETAAQRTEQIAQQASTAPAE